MSKRPQVIQIAMSGIAVPPGRLRSLRPEIVEQLAESMKGEGGLLEPIVVRPRKGGDYWLVAGRHRLMAAMKLKWKTIACTMIQRALWPASTSSERNNKILSNSAQRCPRSGSGYR
jgi:hypothetical protein